MRRAFWRFLMLPGFALSLSGCAELAYYRQAAAGQLELLHARRPVAEVLADPATAPELRRRLEGAQALRAFASGELGLPENGSYRDYADLRRPHAVKNVFAAPELSLEPRRWCYPAVGCMSYRGYFDAAAAQGLAADLRAAGDDVYVADIPAYSTLGWFDDPLLNTFIAWPAGRLAELMFHELSHQRLYVSGDTAFNEAFATAVGRLGAERWLKQQGTAREREDYAADGQRREDFLRLTATAREQLTVLYASARPDAEKRADKQRILTALRDGYQQLKQQWGGYSGYDRWFDRDLNNAKLAGNSTYYRWVPAFLALYEHEGQNFVAFYRAVEAIGQLPLSERTARLDALSASPSNIVSNAAVTNDPPTTHRSHDERRDL
ncbi:MAG: aminopeptidase [Candidatus Competibacteraceae bacterium]|nr:aminopeptidase [Candidatus Competibacteraceae bacterium]MBK8961880.1 aminopeptidase [Candidatus Competibacteraceae bacterium]